MLAIAGAIFGYFMWNKPHKDISAAKEDFTITADSFYKEYSMNETAANEKYLNKVIEVKGSVADLELENADEPTVALSTATEDMTISCGFKKELLKDVNKLKIGDKIKIKGKCDGLGMFGIVITQCSLIIE